MSKTSFSTSFFSVAVCDCFQNRVVDRDFRVQSRGFLELLDSWIVALHPSQPGLIFGRRGKYKNSWEYFFVILVPVCLTSTRSGWRSMKPTAIGLRQLMVRLRSTLLLLAELEGQIRSNRTSSCDEDHGG